MSSTLCRCCDCDCDCVNANGCGCALAVAVDGSTEAVTVQAGDACSGFCGILPVTTALEAVDAACVRLPQTVITEQVYTYGFCPDEALQRGTLFPELVG